MGFVFVDCYDGEQGYISDDLFPWKTVELKGIKYLVDFGCFSSPTNIAYRIVHDREDTAIATTVKNQKLLEELQEKYDSDLEKYISDVESSIYNDDNYPYNCQK
jgi:hypothetical protein